MLHIAALCHLANIRSVQEVESARFPDPAALSCCVFCGNVQCCLDLLSWTWPMSWPSASCSKASGERDTDFSWHFLVCRILACARHSAGHADSGAVETRARHRDQSHQRSPLPPPPPSLLPPCWHWWTSFFVGYTSFSTTPCRDIPSTWCRKHS